MHVNRGLLNWGVFLILLGGIPALVQFGVLDPAALVGAWRLWPLIIVGLGLGLLLRRTSLEFLGGLVVAATLGVVFGSLLAAGPAFAGLGRDCGGGDGGRPFPEQSGSFTGDRASVELRAACRSTTIATAEGAGWSVAGTSRDGAPPSVSGSAGSVTIRSDTGRGEILPFLEGGGSPGAWRITLPRQPTVDLTATSDFGDLTADMKGANVGNLSLTVNFGQADLGLTEATVQSLSITSNFGSTTLRVPAGSSFHGSITANFGSLDLCVPSGVGLRVTVGGGAFSSTDFGDRGMTQAGNTWTSAGYDAAASKVDLSTTANFGNVELHGENCQ
jgi:hypothetical protein